MGAKRGEILFYPLETKIPTFFAINVIGNCQISISRALVLPSPLPTPMNMGHYLWGVERVKCFVNFHLHCIVSNLKNMSKMSMFPSLEKFLRMPMNMRLSDTNLQTKPFSMRVFSFCD